MWHSVTWQYLADHERNAVTDRIAALGARATPTSPFVHLRLEPQRREPDSAHEFLVRLRSWPDGRDATVAVCTPHGPPVSWE